MTEEAMLFRRVQEGCWEAFDVLFHTYAEQLFFYAMGFVNNREEARDIVQGTFITLWEQRGKIQCTGAIYPYLLRLVKNACLNYQVHEKVKERYLLEKRMTEEEGEEVPADEEEEFVGVDCWGSIVYIDAKIIFKKSIFLFTLIGYLLV